MKNKKKNRILRLAAAVLAAVSIFAQIAGDIVPVSMAAPAGSNYGTVIAAEENMTEDNFGEENASEAGNGAEEGNTSEAEDKPGDENSSEVGNDAAEEDGEEKSEEVNNSGTENGSAEEDGEEKSEEENTSETGNGAEEENSEEQSSEGENSSESEKDSEEENTSEAEDDTKEENREEKSSEDASSEEENSEEKTSEEDSSEEENGAEKEEDSEEKISKKEEDSEKENSSKKEQSSEKENTKKDSSDKKNDKKSAKAATALRGALPDTNHIITQGESIQYSDVFGAGGWSTHRYSWNGRIIYCIESNKGAPGNGANYPSSYMADVKGKTTGIDRGLLACAIAHGPGGELDYAGRLWWGDHGRPEIANNDNAMYVVTHIAANYAYAGISSNTREIIYKGVPGDLWGVFDEYMQFLGQVADGEATYQYEGKPTSWDNFWVEVLMPGENTGWQQMAVYAGAQRHSDEATSIDITVPVTKTGDGTHKLSGAVYGLFKGDDTEIERITLSAGQTAEGSFSVTLTEPGEYYVKEIKSPEGYKTDNTKYVFSVDIAGQSVSSSDVHIRINDKEVNVSVSDEYIELKPSVEVRKRGREGASVRGAVYTMYRYDSKNLDKNPSVATARINTAVEGSGNDMSGSFDITFYFENAGEIYYIRETSAPSGYLLDPSLFFFKVVKDGEKLKLESYEYEGALVNGSRIHVNDASVTATSVEEGVFPVSVRIHKTGASEDPNATLEGAVYSVYSCDSVATAEETKKLIGDIPLTVSAQNPHRATGSLKEDLRAGVYFIVEKKAPHGYKLDDRKQFFVIRTTGEIVSTSNVIETGDGVVTETVSDEEIIIPFTPEIEIVKRGSCNVDGDGSDVSKAKFGLFKANGRLLQEIQLSGTATKATGTFSFKIKEPGNYYIQETFTPANFTADTEKYAFHVSLVDDELYSDHQGFVVDKTDKTKAGITIREIPNKYKFAISIYKSGKSLGDLTSLEGAKYGLFDPQGNMIAETVMKADKEEDFTYTARGNFPATVISEGEGGTYYVQETLAPEGYRINKKKYKFTVNIENQTVTVSDEEMSVAGSRVTINTSEEAARGKFRFVKKGEDGLFIEGAEFEVYLKSKLPKAADGSENSYDFDSAEPMQVLTSGLNGVVLSGDLNFGTYVVREVKAPDGYETVAPFEVVIEKDLTTVELGDVIDENERIYIRATKKDAKRDTVILKAGTSYTIVNDRKEKMKDSKGQTVFTCDESGVITIDCGLAPGTYEISEVTPPNGYRADAKPLKIRVDANLSCSIVNGKRVHDVVFANTQKKGKIVLTKTGDTLSRFENGKFIYEQKPLPGAVYELYAAEDIYTQDNQGKLIYKKDRLITKLTTGEDGKETVEDLPLGRYYLKETKAPYGYMLNDTPIEVLLSDDNPEADTVIETVTQFDERQKVGLELYKFDEETRKPLADAKFALYAAEDIPNYKGDILVEKDSLLCYGLSDKTGKIIFDIDLPFNRYVVKEVQAPYGYVKNDEKFVLDAKVPDRHKAEAVYRYECFNAPAKGDVHIIKIGESLTGFKDGHFVYEDVKLSGAEFELYALDVFTCDGGVDEKGGRTRYFEKDERIETVKVDENGEAWIKDKPLGTYYLVETKAPYGMTKLEGRYVFEIRYENQDTPKVISNESILNTRQKIVLSVKKLKRGSAEPLDGGLFGLYAGEDILNCRGEVIVKKGTRLAGAEAKSGTVDFGMDLPHAKYFIREENAVSGYYDTGEIYEIDARYTSQDIKVLGVELIIFNDKISGFGRLMLSIGNQSFARSKTNYVTGDETGNGGYSILIGEQKDIEKSRLVGRLSVWTAILSGILGIVGTICLIIGKRKKR